MCDPSCSKIATNPELVSIVLLFLDPLEEQSEMRLVSKCWYNAHEIAQRTDQHQLELLHDAKLTKRTNARSNLTEKELDALDQELCDCLHKLYNCNADGQESEELIQTMKHYLDCGATASKINPFQLTGHSHDSNVQDEVWGEYYRWPEVDFNLTCFILRLQKECERERSFGVEFLRFLSILQELVCSPCMSWRTHRYGHDGEPLPRLLLQVVMSGWACGPAHLYPNTLFGGHKRSLPVILQAWRLLRLMVYGACQRNSPILSLFQGSLEGADFVLCQNLPWSGCTCFAQDAIRLFLSCCGLDAVVQKIIEPSSDNPAAAIPFFRIPELNAAIRLTLSQQGNVTRDRYDSLLVHFLKYSWRTRPLKRCLRNALKRDANLRWLLLTSPTALTELCLRKDRSFFEQMLQLEARLLARITDNALQVLDYVRGRKERLVLLLDTIRSVRLQKDSVLGELLHHINT